MRWKVQTDRGAGRLASRDQVSRTDSSRDCEGASSWPVLVPLSPQLSESPFSLAPVEPGRRGRESGRRKGSTAAHMPLF